MMHRIFFLCLCAALCGSGSSLSCREMKEFRRFSNRSLSLIDEMAAEATVTTDHAGEQKANDTVDEFLDELYGEAFNASAKNRLRFTVQVLQEVNRLFSHSSAPWNQITVEHFRIAVIRQAEALHPCVSVSVDELSHTASQRILQLQLKLKLHMYFKRLSHDVLKRMGHSAESWELIRKESKTHLLRVDLLLSPILNAN